MYERTTTLATNVRSITDAFAFVMEHIDTVGSEPSIHIGPVWVVDDGVAGRAEFEVSVSGTVEVDA